MRDVTDRFLHAVQGSNSPVVWADIWRGGEVIREHARIAGGEVRFDAGRSVEGALSGLAIVDEDPTATHVDAFGCRVNIRAGFDLQDPQPETVSMGWYDITDVSTVDAWSWFDWTEDAQLTSRVLTIEGVDGMGVVAESDFIAPQQPEAGADCWDTIVDLCAGVVSVLDPGFTAKTIPEGLVFNLSRLGAIKAVAQAWNAFPVMTPDGQLTLATEDGGDTIDAFGACVNIDWWQKESSSRGLKNGVAFSGKDSDGNELVGYATETSGPLRWGGLFGMRPARAASDLMTTQAMVDAAAQTHLETIIARRSVIQSVSALWNPAIELRDRPTLNLPDGSVEAVVAGYTLPLTGGPMTVDLRLPWLN